MGSYFGGAGCNVSSGFGQVLVRICKSRIRCFVLTSEQDVCVIKGRSWL